jgi:hypothetical protein
MKSDCFQESGRGLNPPTSIARTVVVVGLIGSAAMGWSGCNPDLVNAVSGGSQVPLAPGNQPFVHVTVLNDSTAFIDYTISTEDDDLMLVTNAGSTPLVGDFGIIYRCPVNRIALGDLERPEFPIGQAVHQNGLITNVFFEDPPLVEGISFNCGDSVFFVMVNDTSSPSGISIGAGVFSGANQGPVTQIETYQVIRNILAVEGF